ncbi:hypothetical protein G7Y89_g4163 [Cudoniella acicularis]|uniref:FAD-binding PCMH-type domain-containing protein n=1 Tax=Cudoniella acicularis TaxID=354080 RepID=A0A8H4RT00_9HELO|nr:hypothetical protein G7Y89_g4163 [Cudoniella acicularis]
MTWSPLEALQIFLVCYLLPLASLTWSLPPIVTNLASNYPTHALLVAFFLPMITYIVTSPNSLLRMAVIPVVATIIISYLQTADSYISNKSFLAMSSGPTTLLLFSSIDYLVLQKLHFTTDKVERTIEAGTQPVVISEKSNVAPPAHRGVIDTTSLKWAWRVIFSYRAIGSPRAVKNMPKWSYSDPNYAPSRPLFLIKRGAAVVGAFLVLDLLNSQPPPDLSHFTAAKSGQFSGFIGQSVEDIIARMITTVIFWFSLRMTIALIYNSWSLLPVALRIDSPEDWPPYFGSVFSSYSIRTFWSVYWQQSLRNMLVGNAAFWTHGILRQKKGTLVARYLNVTFPFLLSGILHTVLDVCGGVPLMEARTLVFFVLQAFGIMVEDSVEAAYFWLFSKKNGEKTEYPKLLFWHKLLKNAGKSRSQLKKLAISWVVDTQQDIRLFLEVVVISHFESWSALNGTLVIDLSHINSVNVSQDKTKATVGGGIRLGALYMALNNYGLSFHGGICPTVGLGGYVGVGGYNMQGRKLGMAVNDVTSLEIVLATGQVATASATENPDLYWAARGGGYYGIITSITINTQVFPRSAMVSIQFPNASTRYEVARKYIDWAPRQVKEFSSQINMYSDNTNLVGWYLGGTEDQLNSILATSGLLNVSGAEVNIQKNCSTLNSRNFWNDYSVVTTCGDDQAAEEIFASYFNVAPQAFAPIQPVFEFNELTVDSSGSQASPWPRVSIIDKNYIIQKDKQWSDETLHGLIDRIGGFSVEEFFWAELTAFNISSDVTTNSSAFAWEKDAYALFRAEVSHGENATQHAYNQAFFDEFDSFLLPRMGTASYAGYTDAAIKSNPYTAYYGSNVCSLVEVKKRYDPLNFFRNPFSIPPTVPEGVTC